MSATSTDLRGAERVTARRRRRWPRVLAAVLAAVLLLAAGIVAGVAWYFSGLALAVDRSGFPPVPLSLGVDGDGEPDGTVVLPDTPGMSIEGLHGIRWSAPGASGWGVTSAVQERGDGRVVRGWEDREGKLPGTGAVGQIDQDVFLGDPSVVGLAFEEVTLTSDVGDLPTYVVPGPEHSTDTWVVFAHGRGGSREEANRYLPLWHELGYTTVVPSYRNDVVAPQDPSGRYGLGLTEWRDVDAAVGYALDSGAEQVVLAGWSMGAAIQLQVLAGSAHRDDVAALVLDAPVVDWRDTFLYQGSLAGLPEPVTRLAMTFIELRGSLDLDEVDWVERADQIDVPVYLVHSDDDQFVRNEPSRELAGLLPELVVPRFDGPADHTREWNLDPEGYERDMELWFSRTLTSEAVPVG